MTDPNKTQLGAPPVVDPNKTMIGTPIDPNRTIMGAPVFEATTTIKPVQCPVCKTFNPVAIMFCVDCGLVLDQVLDGDAFGAPAVQLPVLVDSTGREYVLRPGVTVIGRQGDIAVEDTRVSRRHAQIEMGQESVTVEDIGSTNGTKVGETRLSAGQKQTVNNGESISLGGFELRLSLPGETNKTQAAMSGRTAAMAAVPVAEGPIATLIYSGNELPLTPGKHKFGRRTDNDLVISDPYVSGSHGEIEVSDTGIYITDTGSTNGTFINDAKLNTGQRSQIQPSDSIRLGQLAIEVRFNS
ncbi:MAG: FHA domain-containing protein [Armatimonadetes bacterium]|nr:FHA domain-containing protein [Armatimonadota bacterium]